MTTKRKILIAGMGTSPAVLTNEECVKKMV